MENWSRIEVELIVSDYFQMLSAELTRKPYKKTEHRNNLLPLLRNRSKASIEYKHHNISAVLINLGQIYLKGYVPLFNYQKLLEEVVIDYLSLNLGFEDKFKQFVEKDALIKPMPNFEKMVVTPPAMQVTQEPTPLYHRSPIKVNYLEKEQANYMLGHYGEELIVQYEKWNLIQLGREKFAEQVQWISKDEGDGAGFDILSKEINGKDKYIEVKTTKLGKETPFFFTSNELSFSKEHDRDYHLYRLFNFEEEAKLFIKTGGLDKICNSVPMTFKGYF